MRIADPTTYSQYRTIEPGQISDASYAAAAAIPNTLEGACRSAIDSLQLAVLTLDETHFACPLEFTEEHFRFFQQDLTQVLQTAIKILTLVTAEVREANHEKENPIG